jgi:hypothetical protein
MYKPNLHLSILTLIFSLSVVSGCNNTTLQSSWRQPISLNTTADSTWENSRKYSFENESLVIGFQNDADFLYVFLGTSNKETQMKIERAGVTVWFDGKGGKEKSFGIQYPVKMEKPTMSSEKAARPSMNQNDLPEKFAGNLDTMEIIGPGKNERVKASINNDLGLSVTRNSNSGPISYELKIPLKTTNQTPFAIGADAGSIIGIGLETGKIEMEMKRDGRSMAGGPPNGRGGSGMGGGFPEGGDIGGGMGKHGKGNMPPDSQKDTVSSKPIKIWAKVVLANSSGNDINR